MQEAREICLDTSGWHPRVSQIYRYWQSIRPAEGGLPGRQHFDPVDIPSLLPGIWLLDVQHRPLRLRYRLVGTGIVQALGREVTGMWLDEAHPEAMSNPDFRDRYMSAVAGGVPNWRKGGPRLWSHRDYATVENLLLPLARDGRRVDMLCAFTLLYRRDGTTAF
jgi:PAS domain-containing protein